jgi:hypothetical protein
MKKNTYNRRINGNKYYVKVVEYPYLVTVVRVASTHWVTDRDEVYAKSYNLFCDDVDRFAANVLSDAVQNREEEITENKKYNQKIQRSLDVVKEEYEK